MRISRSLVSVGITALMTCSAASVAAAPFAPVLDEFWILKGAAGAPLTEIFRDSFSDNALPPSGPDGASTYGVFGPSGMTSEALGKLTMTPSLGDPVLITTTFADLSTSGVRQLATSPANPNFLGQASAFEIHGLYDLSSLPTVAGQSFGVRASDRATGIGNEGNNTYNLFVGVSPTTGERRLVLRLNDFTTNTSTVIDSISIESLLPGADQIELILAKAAGSDLLAASYRLFDYDLANSLVAAGSIASNSLLRIYDGEQYIRAQFETTDRIPVTEPATLALLSVGFAGIAFTRRRSDRAARRL